MQYRAEAWKLPFKYAQKLLLENRIIKWG